MEKQLFLCSTLKSGTLTINATGPPPERLIWEHNGNQFVFNPIGQNQSVFYIPRVPNHVTQQDDVPRQYQILAPQLQTACASIPVQQIPLSIAPVVCPVFQQKPTQPVHGVAQQQQNPSGQQMAAGGQSTAQMIQTNKTTYSGVTTAPNIQPRVVSQVTQPMQSQTQQHSSENDSSQWGEEMKQYSEQVTQRLATQQIPNNQNSSQEVVHGPLPVQHQFPHDGQARMGTEPATQYAPQPTQQMNASPHCATGQQSQIYAPQYQYVPCSSSPQNFFSYRIPVHHIYYQTINANPGAPALVQPLLTLPAPQHHFSPSMGYGGDNPGSLHASYTYDESSLPPSPPVISPTGSLQIAEMSPSAIHDAFGRLKMTFDDLWKGRFPLLHEQSGQMAVARGGQWCRWANAGNTARFCVRCNTGFLISDSTGTCRFHKHGNKCCGLKEPCITARAHVHDVMDISLLRQFQFTPGGNGPEDERNIKVYALDTEKVYTANGLEVARVTMVDIHGNVHLNVFVQPVGRIIDLNTQYSGIKEGFLNYAIPFVEARAKIFQLINCHSILIGHHLSSDLTALKISHSEVVDTAELFKNGPKGRYPSLKDLAKKHLNKEIHERDQGHDSAEDAKICIELIIENYAELTSCDDDSE